MGSNRRDQLVQRVRAARWVAGVGAAGLTAAFSVAAANAFKGHDGRKATAGAAPQQTTKTKTRHVTVPAPDKVPSIASDGSLQPPAQSPQAAPPAQQQAPAQPQQVPQQQAPQPQAAAPVSGGS
jgi:hypothetical protein